MFSLAHVQQQMGPFSTIFNLYLNIAGAKTASQFEPTSDWRHRATSSESNILPW